MEPARCSPSIDREQPFVHRHVDALFLACQIRDDAAPPARESDLQSDDPVGQDDRRITGALRASLQ